MGKRIEIHEFHPTIYPRLIWVAKLRNEKDINAEFNLQMQQNSD